MKRQMFELAPLASIPTKSPRRPTTRVGKTAKVELSGDCCQDASPETSEASDAFSIA
jgi:hypothetical protein